MTQLSNGVGETKVIQAYQALIQEVEAHNYRWRYKSRLQARKSTSSIVLKRTKNLCARNWVYSTKFGTKDRDFARFVKEF